MELMQAVPKPKTLTISTAGALIGLPARASERRVLITQGILRRASAPQHGTYSFYAPDFFLTQPQPWLVPEDNADVRELHADQLAALSLSADNQSSQWTPPSYADFQETFADLQARFESGTLSKAVPVAFEHAPLPPAGIVTAQSLTALLRAPQTLMPYACWTDHGGMLGASPEVLFQVQDGLLTTMALAGTLAAPINPADHHAAEQDFLSDPKERREHALVIDGIAAALAPFGMVRVGETCVLKLPTLWHLQTPIDVVLTVPPSFEALVRSLHPTPALGGSPRNAAVEWLRQQDTPPGRGSFGAPFGVQCPDGSAFCLVAVRNVMWDNQIMRIGAGCGIIRESQIAREWEELRHKRSSVKRLLGL